MQRRHGAPAVAGAYRRVSFEPQRFGAPRAARRAGIRHLRLVADLPPEVASHSRLVVALGLFGSVGKRAGLIQGIRPGARRERCHREHDEPLPGAEPVEVSATSLSCSLRYATIAAAMFAASLRCPSRLVIRAASSRLVAYPISMSTDGRRAVLSTARPSLLDALVAAVMHLAGAPLDECRRRAKNRAGTPRGRGP